MRYLRYLVFFTVLATSAGHADIYRWVDPESSSVKFSNHPPPWFGDPERERNAPAVEVIRYKPPATPEAAKPAAAKAAAAVKPAAAGSPIAALESQWQGLLQFFSSMPANVDFDRGGAAFQQQAEMYKAVSAELDRQDPAGAARRRAAAQETGILDRLRSGMEAQFSTKPPAQK